jgi:hypothetical protein
MKTGYIYKIWDLDDTSLVYYGSTQQTVCQRMTNHRRNCKCEKSLHCSSFEIIKRNNYQYATLEKVEFEELFELRNRERFYIENNKCVNKYIPNRPFLEVAKNYRDNNKDMIKEKRDKKKDKLALYQKEYIKNNKEMVKEKCKKYCEKNKELLKQKRKKYYEKNKDMIKEKRKKYCEKNKELLKQQRKKYYEKNKELINQKQRIYRRNKRQIES